MEEQRFRKPSTGVRFSQMALMSRLQSHQQKEFAKKVSFSIVALIVFIIFFFSFGLKFLINSSLFVGNILSGNKNEIQVENKDIFYGTLNVDNIPSATNSAKFIIGGTIDNFDLIEFYINGEKIKETTNIATDNSFSEEVGDLRKGENEVFIIARNEELKKTKKSEIFNIVYKSEKPMLEISSPSNDSKVNNYEVKIIGRTDKETFIRINNLPIVTDADGSFQTLVRLNEGENKIEITAEDIAGNVEKKTLSITYQKE